MQHCWVSWTSVSYWFTKASRHERPFVWCFYRLYDQTNFFLFHTDLPVYQKFPKSFSLRKKNIVIIPAILNLAQEQPQWRNLIQMSSFLGEERSFIKNETLRDFVGKGNVRKTTFYPYNTLIIRLAPIKVKKRDCLAVPHELVLGFSVMLLPSWILVSAC